MITRCKVCNGIVYQHNKTLLGNPHECPPKWLIIDTSVNSKDEWEDAKEFYEYDPADAAIAAAEWFDSDGDGPTKRVMQVKDPTTGEVRNFNITFDYEVVYHAYRVVGEDT